jgi:hypothetical protein
MKKCKMCKCDIDNKAKLCNHCGSDQRYIYRFVKDTGLINIVSIVVLVLAYIQYNNAKKEKVLAQEAKISAQVALHSIDSLGNRIEKLTKLNTEISYISTHRYTITVDGGIMYPEIFSNKLDSLMQIIEPDRDKQQKWKEKLNKSK